jgi:alkylated DNA repair protein alkB family protein 8
MEERRRDARFVYLENVAGWDVKIESDVSNGTASNINELKQCLVSILCGDTTCLEDMMNNGPTNGVANHGSLTAADVQDDLRQAIQDGLRQSMTTYDSSSLGVELFMKSDTSQKKKKGGDATHAGVYNHFHVGMRTHDDAAELVRELQGKQLEIRCDLPATFLSVYVDTGNALNATKATITMNKLFLDYADVLLPKRIRNTPSTDPNQQHQIPGLPSRSECTSSTSHVHIPGLCLIPNYVSEEEEQVMLAVLTGPDAPWAPAQYTPSGGQIKRRVQHYGYVFDYESADVLRRDGSSKNDSRCPPLPAVEKSGNDDKLEDWIDQKVAERRGWEVVAGVIERTRRIDFTNCAELDMLKSEEGNALDERIGNSSLGTDDAKPRASDDNAAKAYGTTITQPLGSLQKGTYPTINQLTINEYTPGQGIGSHVDTETAFDDGLLIISLNGGIVMEFRKVGQDLKKLVYLPPRSLVLLSEDARYKWEHMIVSRTTDTVDGEVIPRKLRVSLTLRAALTAPVEKEQAIALSRFESTVFPPYWGQTPEAEAIDDKSSMVNRADLITPSTESKHVHAVYDAIATQWHHTRGKRGVLWPGATQFLENLPPGSVVADCGCGDGKYFSAILGAGSYVIGTDISEALLRTASSSEKSGNTKVDGPQYQSLDDDKSALSLNPAMAVADCLHLPLRSGSCDAAICIAVMHHLSTKGRRIRCLAELARIVRVGGLINVQAWALEQESDSKRKFHGSDVLVPFNAQPKYLQASAKNDTGLASNRNTATVGKGVAQMLSESYDGADFDNKKNLVIFQRYCHMYRCGELEELVAQIPTLQLIESAYEKGNHVVLLKVCGPPSGPEE